MSPLDAVDAYLLGEQHRSPVDRPHRYLTTSAIAESGHLRIDEAGLRATLDDVSYRFVDHTAELQLELEAPSRAAVFEDAVLAIAELLVGDTTPAAPSRSREVVVAAGDDPALLAAWLDELLFVAETECVVPQRVESIDVVRDGIRAVVSFAEAKPVHSVKGATYHDLRLAQDGETWRGRVVLDV